MRHIVITKLVLLSLLIVFSGCNSANETLPEGILTKDEMIEIITKIQLLDAAQKEIRTVGTQMGQMQDTNYTIVFNKYGTDYVQFDSSLKVYAAHPKLLETIMEQVAENLNKSK